jgi:hypothetical protein
MTHNIIKTENYLLVVDDLEIKEGDYTFQEASNLISKYNNAYSKKIIAHLPLNNSPVLEGVPLLPPLEDDEEVWEQGLGPELEKLLPYMKHLDDGQYNAGQLVGFEIGATWGYNKTKEKYKYTEEDLRKAIELSDKNQQLNDPLHPNEIIQSLQQPKMPVAFECEDEYVHDDTVPYPKTLGTHPKTVGNPPRPNRIGR